MIGLGATWSDPEWPGATRSDPERPVACLIVRNNAPYLFLGETPKIKSSYSENPYVWWQTTTTWNLKHVLTKTKQRGGGSRRRLVQYHQLPDKNSLDVSRDIYNFSRHFKVILFMLFRDLPRKPNDVTMYPGWETLTNKLTLTTKLRWTHNVCCACIYSVRSTLLFFASINIHPLRARCRLTCTWGRT